MGEELEKVAESEAREKESTRYYQRRMEEMKADMDELVQRELESSRRRVELVRACCPVGSHCPRATGGFPPPKPADWPEGPGEAVGCMVLCVLRAGSWSWPGCCYG